MVFSLKKPDKFDSLRPFKVIHQTLGITAINFQKHSLVGYTELLLVPLKPELRNFVLNAKQCRIYQVCFNGDLDATFEYNDPTLEICSSESNQRNLDHFDACHSGVVSSVDPDAGNGELTIKIPQKLEASMRECRPVKVNLEFSLENPSGGLQFVVPDGSGSDVDRGCHAFSYGRENSSRLWFPCVDAESEPCTWSLRVTVDNGMTPVCPGELVDTVYNADSSQKTFYYSLNVPTSAPNIGIAVGPFEILVDPAMHEVTHFCLPELKTLLSHTTSFLHQVIEFYEQTVGNRFPYSNYKQVFVDQAPFVSQSYASMGLFDTNLLHHSGIIDHVPEAMTRIAQVVATQFFGCFITRARWSDAWLPKAMAGYLSGLYRCKTFGTNEYLYSVREDIRTVCAYEADTGEMILDAQRKEPAQSVSTRYIDVMEKKAYLVMRIMEHRVGRDTLIQVLSKLLSLASQCAGAKYSSGTWSNILVSTHSFFKLVAMVSGKDLASILEQWIFQSGCPSLHANYTFNRKRNCIELDIIQEPGRKGVSKYMGPLTVRIQETDGSFLHTILIEDMTSHHDVICHSKGRRPRKKRVPLMNGEEIDVDFNYIEDDSPVMWVRLDPDMLLIRRLEIRQSDYMWHYQARFERDVTAQLDAVVGLLAFPNAIAKICLSDIVENDRCFYRVRLAALHSLASVVTSMASSVVASSSSSLSVGYESLLKLFRRMYGSRSCPEIIKLNDFSNFQSYFLLQAFPLAMSRIRNSFNLCPKEVLAFILDLIKYNDNRLNKFSDGSYRSVLVEALSRTITPAPSLVTSSDKLTPEANVVLEEITRLLNLEKVIQSYKYEVTVACIKALRVAQCNGHIPLSSEIFQSYARVGIFIEVRLAAFHCLVDMLSETSSRGLLAYLLDAVEEDPEPRVRYSLVNMLIDKPPFLAVSRGTHPLDTVHLVDRLWLTINSMTSHDSFLRGDLVTLYRTMYGSGQPCCLPPLDLPLQTAGAKRRHPVADSSGGAEEEMRRRKKQRRYLEEVGSVESGLDSRDGSPTSMDGSRRTSPNRDGSRRTSPNRDGSRRTSPNRDGSRRTSPNRDWSRRTSPNRDGSRITSPNRDGSTITSPNRDGSRRTSPNRGGSRRTSPNRDGSMRTSPNTDGSRRTSPNRDWSRRTSPNRDGSRITSPNRDGSRRTSPNRDGSRRTSPNRDGSRRTSPNRDGSRRTSPNRDGSRRTSPNRDGSRRTSPNRDGSRRTSPNRDGDGSRRTSPNRDGSGGTRLLRYHLNEGPECIDLTPSEASPTVQFTMGSPHATAYHSDTESTP